MRKRPVRIIGSNTQLDISFGWGARGTTPPNVFWSAGISRRSRKDFGNGRTDTPASSPAVTTRGFDEAEMRQVAALIAEVLEAVAKDPANTTAAEESVRAKVKDLTDRFPLYAWKK